MAKAWPEAKVTMVEPNLCPTDVPSNPAWALTYLLTRKRPVPQAMLWYD